MPPHKVLITRPIAAARPIADALMQRGFEPVIDPLMEIRALDFTVPEGPFATILITSANAIPALAGIERHIPVVTVGEMTRQEAVAAGFAATCLGQTVSEALPHLARLQGPILYLSGQDIAYDIANVRRVPVYVARPMALKKATIDLLSAGRIGWIVLFSRRSAEALKKVISGMGEQAWIAETRLVCLSTRTADPVRGLAWREIRIAAQPTETALIEALGIV